VVSRAADVAVTAGEPTANSYPAIQKDADMRPFRFLATVNGYPSFAELTSLARKAEAIGCSSFVLPDHIAGLYAPMPLLATVAAVTERLRVGTFVLNAGLRHPAVVAHDLATLDALSGGRLDIGLGAGWNKPEQDAIGIPFEPAGVRIERLTEVITILKGCFSEGPFSFSGKHYTITGHDGAPKPVQRPHPPIFLGGGRKRLLTLAAREAQIIGLAPRMVPGDRPRGEAWSLTAAATEEKINWIREAAGDRFGELELNTYAAGGPTVITDDPRAEARRRVDLIRALSTGTELTVDEILDSPHVFIGSVKDLTRKFMDLRERFGISSFRIDDLDALAPVVEELAGQ
jgi:probable F420-dependent oxidoreductase